MRKFQKKMALDAVQILGQAHDAITDLMKNRDMAAVLNLLEQCQDAALRIGTMIEKTEAGSCRAVSLLENYCELIFQYYTLVTQEQTFHADEIDEQLRDHLVQIRNSIQKDIKEHVEVVFLPYKASMWDSLESIWMAADADENCDAYVIPIPYYDKNPDRSVREIFYEWDQYPEYVPVTKYEEYDFAQRRPDMIFIHNPYDAYNRVTSVHPFFYSSNLRNFTDRLIYVPYFCTSGDLEKALMLYDSYFFCDYIIVQAEKYRELYDSRLPQEKLVPLGSPKFDRVIRRCNCPPGMPEAWKRKIKNKKVYFFNTSINGMLKNPRAFLRKLEYVFRCFEGRTDACLLWRPHPLLETTFSSMLPEDKPIYDALKKDFIEKDLGIYDTTPDFTNSVAFSDACMGNTQTSITPLFGIVGKPIFLLDNNIDTMPDAEDYKGGILKGFLGCANDEWMVTQGNKLYHSLHNDYHYNYCCDLSSYAYGDYYLQAISINGKNYVCPGNAQDIVVVNNKGIERRIELDLHIEQEGAFYGMISCERYLFLIPDSYPAIVRYDTINDELQYFNNHLDVFTSGMDEGRTGGYCVQDGILYIASYSDDRILAIDTVTGKEEVLTTKAEHACGCMAMVSNGTELWLLPCSGNVITRWNPLTREVHEYKDYPEGLKCEYMPYGDECMKQPFSGAAFYKDDVYFSPCWANMYIRLDKKSGRMTEWKPPFSQPENIKNGYYATLIKSMFIRSAGDTEGKEYLLFSYYDRRLYRINFETDEYSEIEITFDMNDLKANEPGFKEYSQWLQYACKENAFNSLTDFLDGNITGDAFDRERQIQAYSKIAANHDGTSGEKIYSFVRGKV